MRILLLSSPVSGVDRAPFIEDEDRTIEQLRKDGVIQQIYVRADGAGAVSIVDADSVDVAMERLNQLPFVINGCITIEAVPVTELFS
jgi:hypothetical protein